MSVMTETHQNQDTAATPIHRPDDGGGNRLYRALAWVGIVAGSLFIVATVFFSGYVIGKYSGGGPHHGPHRVLLTPFHKGMGPGDRMGPDGQRGRDGQMGPGEGPRSARLTPPSASSPPANP
jgi:hypothetical protein